MIGIRVTNLGGAGRLNHVLVCGGVNAWLPQHEPPIPIPVGQRTMVDIVFTPALNHPQLTVVFQVIVMDADGVSVQDRTAISRQRTCPIRYPGRSAGWATITGSRVYQLSIDQ